MVFIINILKFLDMLLSLYLFIVVAAAVISWVSPDPRNTIVMTLRRLTEPAFARIRRVIPTTFGGLDIAPMVLILAIIFLQSVVISGIIHSLRG